MTALVARIASTFGIGVVIGFVLLLSYPRLKLLVSDVLRLLAVFGRWFRKKSLETEVEGTINTFTKNFNSGLPAQLLPNCKVEWVTEDNKDSFLHEGKAIVRLSLHRDNHDLNLYNAAYMYVKTGALPRTKPYLRKVTAAAIDLLLTRLLLVDSRRAAALGVLNDRFRDEAQEIKAMFTKLDDTESSGFFRPLLLQELHFFGEALGNKAPRNSFEVEAEGLVDWLYELAVREEKERTKLQYTSENIKVGVILIADVGLFEKYGLVPYRRRAMRYATAGFGCIYLCSRGKSRGALTKRIATELSAKAGFEVLTKRPDVIRYNNEGQEVLITCIALKPDLTTIIYDAWSQIGSIGKGGTLTVTVTSVTNELINVDAFGLTIEIQTADASSVPIQDLRRYFESEQELIVRILELDIGNQIVRLSNRDTPSDPKILIAQLQGSLDVQQKSLVRRIITFMDQEVGVNVTLTGNTVLGYLPRDALTYSRFSSLSDKYPIDSSVIVIPARVDVNHKNLVCRLPYLRDPWEDASNRYMVGSSVPATIRQVAERRITCELEEGVEGLVPLSEVSWGSLEQNLDRIKIFEVGSVVTAQVMEINGLRRTVSLSLKRVTKSPAELYIEQHNDMDIKATVEDVSSLGAQVVLEGAAFRSFLPAKEVRWGYCRDVRDHMASGDTIVVRALRYDEYYDNVVVSRKRALPNHFDEFRARFSVGEIVTGRPYECGDGRISVKVEFENGLSVEAFVHKSQLSSLVFVDETNIANILEMKVAYPFEVRGFDDAWRLVELSRRGVLKKSLDGLKYGDEYDAKIVYTRNCNEALGKTFEAVVLGGNNGKTVGPGTRSVVFARIDRQDGRSEVKLA